MGMWQLKKQTSFLKILLQLSPHPLKMVMANHFLFILIYLRILWENTNINRGMEWQLYNEELYEILKCKVSLCHGLFNFTLLTGWDHRQCKSSLLQLTMSTIYANFHFKNSFKECMKSKHLAKLTNLEWKSHSWQRTDKY